MPKLNSDQFSPEYEFWQEIRSQNIDSTLAALITLYTRDKSCNENRIVGQTVIPFFVNKYSKK